MIRTLAILTPFLVAWSPQAFPQDSRTIPTEIYKCTEGGKAVYQDGLCASGPNKPLKSHDARGIEAPKAAARAPEPAPSGPAPVAIIPYTPSKPLGTTGMARQPTPCRSVNGGSCPPTY
jgi:hypothetical protein